MASRCVTKVYTITTAVPAAQMALNNNVYKFQMKKRDESITNKKNNTVKNKKRFTLQTASN